MDNMTAKVSCFARAYHYKNNSIRIFTDDIAEKLLGEDYNQIAKSMSDGIDFFCPGFEGTREEGLRLILDRQLSPSVLDESNGKRLKKGGKPSSDNDIQLMVYSIRE